MVSATAPRISPEIKRGRLQLPVLRATRVDLPARAAGDPTAPAPGIHFDFDIPRLGRRVVAELVTHTAVLPFEFNVGANQFSQLDVEQAWDYGLDLKTFMPRATQR